MRAAELEALREEALKLQRELETLSGRPVIDPSKVAKLARRIAELEARLPARLAATLRAKKKR